MQVGEICLDRETALASKSPEEHTHAPVFETEEVKVHTRNRNRKVVEAISVGLAKYFDCESRTPAYDAVVLAVVYRSMQLSREFSDQFVQLGEVHDSAKPAVAVTMAFSFEIPVDMDVESATVFPQHHENTEVWGSPHQAVATSTLCHGYAPCQGCPTVVMIAWMKILRKYGIA